MLALLVLGAMNPFVMLSVTAVIGSEKLAPKPLLIVYSTGTIALIAGTVIMLQSL